MGTTIRPELSKSNKYWIEKHRYYELKHFCMQYPIWKRYVKSIDGLAKRPDLLIVSSEISDPTARAVLAREHYQNKIDLVERCARESDPVIGEYVLQGVVTGLSYDKIKARLDIPCCKDVYYDIYRKFFWLLNHSHE